MSEQNPLELFFETSERQYGENWVKEAMQWDARGIYADIASNVRLKKEGRHLDFGSGWGHMLGRLHMRCQQERCRMNLLGVDVNPYLAANAYLYLQEQNKLPTALSFGTGLVIEPGNGSVKVGREFIGPETDDQRALLKAQEAIGLVLDDVRTANVLRDILQKDRLSSATFLFPGAGSYLAYAKPFTVKRMSTAEERERVLQNANATRESVYRVAAEFMERDGQLIVAERMHKEKDADDETILRIIAQGIGARMGTAQHNWELERTLVTKGLDTGVQSPIKWMTQDPTGTLRDRDELAQNGGGHGVALMEFRRNKTATANS